MLINCLYKIDDFFNIMLGKLSLIEHWGLFYNFFWCNNVVVLWISIIILLLFVLLYCSFICDIRVQARVLQINVCPYTVYVFNDNEKSWIFARDTKLVKFLNRRNLVWFFSTRKSGHSQWESGKRKSCEREARVRLSRLWSTSEST